MQPFAREPDYVSVLRDGTVKQINPLTGMPEEIVVGFYDQSNNAFNLSLGLGGDCLSFGGTLKFLYGLFSRDKAFGLGGDVGVRLALPRLEFGATLKDIGDTRYDWREQNDQLAPWWLKVDGGLCLLDRKIRAMDVSGRLCLGGRFDAEEERLDVGLECGLMGLLFLRAGMAGADFAAGLGFEFERLNVDYAFTQSDEFYTHHRISFELSGSKEGVRRAPPLRGGDKEGGEGADNEAKTGQDPSGEETETRSD